ncbi:MAG: TlpA disulfide reductase family protein [Pseudomonadota bacterium]
MRPSRPAVQAPRRNRPRSAGSAFVYSAALAAAIGAGAAMGLAGLAGTAVAGSPPAEGVSAEARAGLAAAASEALPNLVVHEAARGPWTTPFKDGSGAKLTMAAFEGEIVVLNLWATWCPPCVHEMPSLDRLSAALEGSGARVVTLSTDRGGADRVRDFFADTGNEDYPKINHLEIHVDKTNKFPREAAVIGLPVTMILDREGREIARLTGDAEWDAPAIVKMIKALAEATAGPLKDAAAGPSTAANRL